LTPIESTQTNSLRCNLLPANCRLQLSHAPW